MLLLAWRKSSVLCFLYWIFSLSFFSSAILWFPLPVSGSKISTACWKNTSMGLCVLEVHSIFEVRDCVEWLIAYLVLFFFAFFLVLFLYLPLESESQALKRLVLALSHISFSVFVGAQYLVKCTCMWPIRSPRIMQSYRQLARQKWTGTSAPWQLMLPEWKTNNEVFYVSCLGLISC